MVIALPFLLFPLVLKITTTNPRRTKEKEKRIQDCGGLGIGGKEKIIIIIKIVKTY